MSFQFPLALKFPADQHFAAYIGQSESRALVEAVASGERNDRLYLAGPAGSGKTHLLLAACAAAQQHGARSVYVPFTTIQGGLADVLAGQENCDLICLDGLEVVAGHRESEIALFHFHNRARDRDVRLIYAGTAMPAAMPFQLPDLASRLEQCTRLALTSLDEIERRVVLRQRAARRGLTLDDAVLDYLFRHFSRDLGSLTLLLDRLDRESLAAQRRVTLPFLRGIAQVEKGF